MIETVKKEQAPLTGGACFFCPIILNICRSEYHDPNQKETDPDTCLTETAIRTLLRNGAVPCARVGKKYLVTIEALEIYLAGSLSKNTETPPLSNGGRRWAIR